MSFDRTFQIHATAPKHGVTSSQHYETHPNVPVLGIVCVYRDSHIKRLDPSNSRYWLQVWSYSDKEEADVTKITDTMCELKKK
jgi:hypothetical protein